MPFAAVLTRASCCFFLRLSRFHARKRNSGSSLNRLPMLRHLVNLQAPITLRQGIPLLLCEPSDVMTHAPPGARVDTLAQSRLASAWTGGADGSVHRS